MRRRFLTSWPADFRHWLDGDTGDAEFDAFVVFGVDAIDEFYRDTLGECHRSTDVLTDFFQAFAVTVQVATGFSTAEWRTFRTEVQCCPSPKTYWRGSSGFDCIHTKPKSPARKRTNITYGQLDKALELLGGAF